MNTLLQHIGSTPLVPLTRIGRGLPRQVLVKCEHMNPGGSIKDRIACAMLRSGWRKSTWVALRVRKE